MNELDALRNDLRIALAIITRLNGDLRRTEDARDRARGTLARLNAIPRPSSCTACQDAVRFGLTG